jgi:hypothetical protein
MDNLFGSRPLPGSLELINFQQFEDDPAFRAWIESTDEKKINTILREVIHFTEAKTAEEALQYLYRVSKSKNLQKENGGLTAADFDGFHHGKAFTKLKRELGEEVLNFEYLRGFGVFLHSIVQDVLTGSFFSHTENLKVRSEYGTLFPIVREKIEVLSAEYLEDLRASWEILSSQLGNEQWMKNYTRLGGKERDSLYRLLLPFLQSPAGNALMRKKAETDFGFYFTLTLMTLASAVLFIGERGHRAGLKEIPILWKRCEIGGWRLDFLAIASVDGEFPTEKHRRLINNLQRMPFRSLGQVIRATQNILRTKKVEFRICEFKFAVGDGLTRRHIIQPNEINGVPLQKHEKQVKKYLALANFDNAFSQGRRFVWDEYSDLPFTQAELIYFFPSIEPVVYPIYADGETQRKLFFDTIVQRKVYAQKNALLRRTMNELIDEVISLLRKIRKQSNGRKNGKKRIISENETITLFKFLPPHEEVWDIIQQQRKFIDIYHCVEETSKRGVYRFHMERLLSLIKNREIDTRRFRGEKGLLRCLLPQHSERTPSLSLDLTKGVGHCFGCGANFVVDPDSIPEGFELLKSTNIRNAVKAHEQENLFSLDVLKIPQEHFTCMGYAQALLKKAFFKSPAVQYIKEIRHLDPHISYELGAGFFSDAVGHRLIYDLTYEALIRYGMIKFSSSIPLSKSLVPFLKKQGMKEEFILRKERIQGTDQFIDVFPYFSLKGRVTFPLSFGTGKITNFYGRAIDIVPKDMRHYKLSKEYTGVPHGMINANVLESLLAEVIVVEGPFDLQTLIECGYHGVVGSLGTLNGYILTEIIKRKIERTGVGYDNDKGGTRGTLNTQRFLCEQGGEDYPFYDFTRVFAEKYPDFLNYKDFNDWWISGAYNNK